MPNCSNIVVENPLEFPNANVMKMQYFMKKLKKCPLSTLVGHHQKIEFLILLCMM
jgi:hypothetical protein